MFLSVCSLVQTGDGTILPNPGVPNVTCLLNAAQATRVMNEGIPAALVAAIDDAAAKAAWAPRPEGDREHPGFVVLDPAPYFR